MGNLFSQFLGYVADFGTFVGGLLANFETAKTNYNWIVILFFLVVVFLVGFTLGRSRLLLSLLSIYIAAFIETHFIYFSNITVYFKQIDDYWLHVALFLLFYAAIFTILNLSVLKSRLTIKDTSFLSISVLAILKVGFLLSIIVSYIPIKNGYELPASIFQYFGTPTAQFFWAVLPIVAAVFLRGKKEMSLPKAVT